MTSDYLSFFFNVPNLSYDALLSLFLLAIMRVAPIVALAPFLGAKVTPAIVRMGMAIALAVIFLPTLIVEANEVTVGFNTTFIGYSIKELLIGFILGVLSTIPFYIAEAAGIYIDFMRGASIMMQQDPSMRTQASPIGILYNYILIVLFFQIDGPFLFFDAVLQSYQIVPVDGFINPAFFSANVHFWEMAQTLLNYIITIAVQIAAPSLLAILMAEMFLGIANRLAPQVQIAFLGMSLKSLLGIGLLWVAWFFVLKQLSYQTVDWFKTIDRLLHGIKIYYTH